MTRAADAFARAAEALVGSPFRLHGRSSQTGLDCIGVAICALEATGRSATALPPYGLRNTLIDRHAAFAVKNGFVPVSGTIAAGDLLLVQPGPAQHHLLVAVGRQCFVHAHAGLRQVVRQSGAPEWPLLAHWRLGEKL